ncbi:MAG: hypothetical protein H0W81_10865 [Chloroflexi bacterium]|nr:hypothetical protein [Chloroflexota bacterium]
MTADRDFDALLRSWFDADAAPAQRQDLLESVRAATARSRPRPAWLVRVRGEPMPELARPGISRFATMGLAAATVVAAVILGFVLVTRPWQDIGPEPDATGTPGATQEATPSPTSAGQARTFGNLATYQARLVSDTVGWVATESSLYRTLDSGLTWTEVQLPTGGESVVTSIVDDRTVFLSFSGEPWTLAATHDGGASWVETTVTGVPASPYFGFFAMQSTTVGTATFFSDPANLLYQTTDGGASWTGPVTPQQPDVGAFLFKFGFPDERGVLSYSNGKYDYLPFDDRLWLSTDGGQTWLERSFPTDAASPAGLFKGLSGKRIDSTHWLIAVRVSEDPIASPTSKSWTAFYESSDDGHSWRFINQIPNVQASFEMLTSTDWVGCSDGSGARCWSTLDAGASWREGVLPDAYPGSIEQFSFASVNHGWARISCTDSEGRPRTGGTYCNGTLGSRLLETTDGGQTWRPIG